MADKQQCRAFATQHTKGLEIRNDEPNYEQKAPRTQMPPFKAVTFSKLQFWHELLAVLGLDVAGVPPEEDFEPATFCFAQLSHLEQ